MQNRTNTSRRRKRKPSSLHSPSILLSIEENSPCRILLTIENLLVSNDPKELVVTVKLPGVESAAAVELDIFEKKIVIQCENPVYKLDVSFKLCVIVLYWML